MSHLAHIQTKILVLQLPLYANPFVFACTKTNGGLNMENMLYLEKIETQNELENARENSILFYSILFVTTMRK